MRSTQNPTNQNLNSHEQPTASPSQASAGQSQSPVTLRTHNTKHSISNSPIRQQLTYSDQQLTDSDPTQTNFAINLGIEASSSNSPQEIPETNESLNSHSLPGEIQIQQDSCSSPES